MNARLEYNLRANPPKSFDIFTFVDRHLSARIDPRSWSIVAT